MPGPDGGLIIGPGVGAVQHIIGQLLPEIQQWLKLGMIDLRSAARLNEAVKKSNITSNAPWNTVVNNVNRGIIPARKAEQRLEELRKRHANNMDRLDALSRADPDLHRGAVQSCSGIPRVEPRYIYCLQVALDRAETILLAKQKNAAQSQADADRRKRGQDQAKEQAQRENEAKELRERRRSRRSDDTGPPLPTEENIKARRTRLRGMVGADAPDEGQCGRIKRENDRRKGNGQRMLDVPWFCEDEKQAIQRVTARENEIRSTIASRRSGPPPMVPQEERGRVYHYGSETPRVRRA